MSEVKVNKISPRSGTDVTLGDSGDTFTIPAGATLTNNGTASGFGISWQSDIKTSAFTAVAGEGYWINTTSAAITVTLPASASVGDEIEFTDYARTWGTNAVTLNPNSLNYQGNSSPNPEYNTDGQHVRIVYSGATQGWIPTVDDDVTLETPQTYSADFLVVAGGGGGGGGNAGGGGAGGYRNSYSTESSGGGGSSESSLTFNAGTVYTITVGAGGTGGIAFGGKGTNGSDSSISGSDITTITSIGGGGGGSGDPPSGSNVDGNSGGSGGGAGQFAPSVGTGGSGTANQGYAGGNASPSFNYDGGGGGGAGSVGANSSNDVGGNGGNGLSSSITGSAVNRAGGGGGGGDTTGGTGGSSVGGNGSSDPATPTDGTVNTGSGGGGARGIVDGGDGGSGVVILRVPTASYSGTTTGSPTVSEDGTDTVIVFNASGSYTG